MTTEASLRDLFHLVGDALPSNQVLASVPPETPVREALRILDERSFNQLPVLAGTEVLGVFSYRSFTKGLAKPTPREREPLELPVEELLEDLTFA